VNEVMLQAEFPTDTNINRVFRRIKGCSPSDWRTLSECDEFPGQARASGASFIC
jgi:AraC-like DNA-binding protein